MNVSRYSPYFLVYVHGHVAAARNLDWDIYEIMSPYYLLLEIVTKNLTNCMY